MTCSVEYQSGEANTARAPARPPARPPLLPLGGPHLHELMLGELARLIEVDRVEYCGIDRLRRAASPTPWGVSMLRLNTEAVPTVCAHYWCTMCPLCA